MVAELKMPNSRQSPVRTICRRVAWPLVVLVALGIGWFAATVRFRMTYGEAVHAANYLPATAPFLALFPESRTTISYFTAWAGRPTWNATIRTDRIEIHAWAPIRINRLGHSVAIDEPLTIMLACIDPSNPNQSTSGSFISVKGLRTFLPPVGDPPLSPRELLDALADFHCK